MDKGANICMKYLSFSPYRAGFNNVVMSYEMAFALAYITGRVLITPPRFWSPFLDTIENDKSTWCDIKEVYSKSVGLSSQEVLELKNLETINSYTGKIQSTKDIFVYKTKHNTVSEDHTVFVHKLENVINNEDFKKFAADRQIEDLNRPEKILHFENGLFGHFWYHVYAGDVNSRNNLKTFINNIFVFNQDIIEYAKQMYNRFGVYNALHLRRNDFCIWLKSHFENTVMTSNQVVNRMRQAFNAAYPLYIATDEINEDFLKEIKKSFYVVTYKDLGLNVSKLKTLAIEQQICANAKYFLGTYFSTYSKRINIARGLANKQAQDYSGLNRLEGVKDEEKYKTYPWFYKENKRWMWHDSSYLHWTQERVESENAA